MTDIAKIAEGLTEGQREAIRSLDRRWVRARTCSFWSNIVPGAMERRFERSFGAIQAQYRLTPLGLAVRAHLERER